MTTRSAMAGLRRKWQIALVGVVGGMIVAAAELIGGNQPPQAILSLTIIVLYALLVVRLEGRSETMAMFAGHPVDERWQAIHEHALGLTAQIGVVVALAGFVVTQVQRGETWPFVVMASTMGLAYIGGVLLYRWRS